MVTEKSAKWKSGCHSLHTHTHTHTPAQRTLPHAGYLDCRTDSRLQLAPGVTPYAIMQSPLLSRSEPPNTMMQPIARPAYSCSPQGMSDATASGTKSAKRSVISTTYRPLPAAAPRTAALRATVLFVLDHGNKQQAPTHCSNLLQFGYQGIWVFSANGCVRRGLPVAR